MSHSPEDMWDLLHSIDKKLDVLQATTSLKFDVLEGRASKAWQVKLALFGATFAVPMAGLAILMKAG